MAFPRPINLEDQLLVDEVLLDEDGSNRIRSLPFRTSDRRQAYFRLAHAVKVIRSRARSLLANHFSMEQYLLTQFILLYGLLRYEEYEPYVSTRALGLIAKRLQDAGQLPFCRDG